MFRNNLKAFFNYKGIHYLVFCIIYLKLCVDTEINAGIKNRKYLYLCQQVKVLICYRDTLSVKRIQISYLP